MVAQDSDDTKSLQFKEQQIGHGTSTNSPKQKIFIS